MSLEFGMWRIDKDSVAEVSFLPMEAESRLERILDRNIGIAAPHLMVIGRQVRTSFDKVLDLWQSTLKELTPWNSRRTRPIAISLPKCWITGRGFARFALTTSLGSSRNT
jgi:hypothetical protein